MEKLRIAFDFFAATALRNWPGLCWYLAGWLVYRATGLRLFNERTLRFRAFSVVANVQGLSGLVFLHEVLMRNIYRFPVIEQDERIGVVFDAGANCGFFSLTQASRHGRWRFFSFEPHPNTYRNLQKNIAANRLEDRIKPIHAAVGASSGTCPLEVSPESSMAIVADSSSKFLKNPVQIEVRLCTLDEVSAAEGVKPDLLKIDVEGFEAEVLKGAPECLKTARHVVLECHSKELEMECRRQLNEAGFQVEQKSGLLFAHR
jgi:FkbM family methyltransferase